MPINAILIDPGDNAATVIEPVRKGQVVGYAAAGGAESRVTALEDIPIYHKIAVCDIPAGGAVVKYGERIGEAGEDIRKGSHVHVHNVLNPSRNA